MLSTNTTLAHSNTSGRLRDCGLDVRAVGRLTLASVARAAVLVEPQRFEVREVELPELDPKQVRVQLEGCGVCASNLTPWEGRPWFQYPFAPGNPGHEGWGVVQAVGRDVTGVHEGERVTLLGEHAFATHADVDPKKLVPLPAALHGRPFPGEPLACAFNVLARCNVEPGQTVAIVGIGFMGAVLTTLCRDAGAEVIAISRRRSSLELAERMGAHTCVPMDDHNGVIARVGELTAGRLCDVVIECAGAQWPLDLASAITCVRGRLVIAGYHQDGARQIDMQLWNWRGLDVINAHERDDALYMAGMRRAVAAVAEGRLDPFGLLTHEFPLDELDVAFELMRSKPEGFVKAVVCHE
jgi:threonine dehydrogenase-like Zn-dependent dehydrogenase